MTEPNLHLAEQGVVNIKNKLHLGGDYFSLDRKSKFIIIEEQVHFLLFDVYSLQKLKSNIIYSIVGQVQFLIREN